MSFITGDFPVTADGNNVGRVIIEQNGLTLVFDCTCDYKSHDIVRLAAVCDGKYVPLGVMVPTDGGQAAGSTSSTLRLKKSFTKNALTAIGYDEAGAFHLVRPGAVYTERAENEKPEIVLPAYDAEPVVYNDFPDPVEYVYDFDPQPEPLTQDPEQVLEISDVEPAASEAELVPELPGFRDLPEMTLPALDGWMTISNPGTLFNDPGIQEFCGDISGARCTEQDGCVLLAIPVSPTEPFPLMPVFCFGSSGSVGGQECVIFKVKNGNLTL